MTAQPHSDGPKSRGINLRTNQEVGFDIVNKGGGLVPAARGKAGTGGTRCRWGSWGVSVSTAMPVCAGVMVPGDGTRGTSNAPRPHFSV